uniref:Helicase-associated domain-containing protein n=1 Tax=Ditylum brightwellii TaxID=49249 RepID=A0A7S4S7U3_9STRA
MVSQKVSKIIDVTTRELPTTRERRSTTATPMTWSNMLGELRKYKEIHGHCSVPARFSSKKRLAKWVSKQRKEYWEMKEGRSSIMTAERVDILNNLGFKWKLHEDNWHDMLDDLKEYKERRGDCLVPLKYVPNPQLGKWVKSQREAYKHTLNGGNPSSLMKKRITLLNKLGFVWFVGYDIKWFVMLGELRKYKETHGHCSVPARCSSNKRLANWVSKQRQVYYDMKEGRSSIMTAERVDILNNLGFKWKMHEDNWHDMLDDLKEFKERHGDCIVPQKYSPNPQLGRWVYTQRRAYTRNSLTKERITLLNKLGFVWKLRKSRTLIK